MTKSKPIPFAEMRRLLQGLGYKEKCVNNAIVFYRSKNDMVIFRIYADDESVRLGDVLSTRKFLDMRGVLDEADFDAFFEKTATSA